MKENILHGFSPQVETNKRLEQWPNTVLLSNNNIQQSHVRSKPDALEWKFFSDLDSNPTAFCGNNSNGFLDPLQQHGNDLGGQLLSSNNNNTKEGFHMGQQHKLHSGFMASDAGFRLYSQLHYYTGTYPS